MRTGVSRHVIAIVGIAGCAAASSAATVEQAASVLIFPRVVVDEQRDTFIQIVNHNNLPAHAVCYARAAGNPSPLSEDEVSVIRLQPKQTTHWSAARGREVDPEDPVCSGDGAVVVLADCDGAGFDPGRVPPLPAPFDGSLICIETDASGAPASGNAFRGTATLIDRSTGEVSKYSAFGLQGNDNNDGNGDLCVGSTIDDDCPLGSEYHPCSARWTLIHPSEAIDADSVESSTWITIVPCAVDVEFRQPERVTFQFRVTNEFEQRLSASTTVDGSATLRLSEISVVFQRDTIGGDLLATEMTSVDDSGFVVIAETTRVEPGGGSATSAVSFHGDPLEPGEATMRVPQ